VCVRYGLFTLRCGIFSVRVSYFVGFRYGLCSLRLVCVTVCVVTLRSLGFVFFTVCPLGFVFVSFCTCYVSCSLRCVPYDLFTLRFMLVTM